MKRLRQGPLADNRPLIFSAVRPFSPTRAFRDAAAGLQMAAISIPQVLGYTRIAGMPAVTGLYTLLLPLIAFAAFGSSRFLVVAADSASAAILAGGIAGMASPASARYSELAALVALLTGFFLLLARILRLGFLSDFLSRTVLTGFLTGVGFQVGIAMLPQILGLDIPSRRPAIILADVFARLPQTNLASFALAALVVAGVLLSLRLAPRFPGALIAVVLAIAASAQWNFAALGIRTLGPVASGLPRLALPPLQWSDIERLAPVAASCFVMIVAQSSAVARIYAVRHSEPLSENRDLLGLAAANAAAAISGAFVVNGSPTQTSMAESSGARSQIAHLTTAAVAALVLAFMVRPLQYLPQCVLGAIVFVVAVRLVDLRGLRAIRRESPGEWALAMTTAAVVVLIGVEQGILLAMVMSLVRIVDHSYRPHTAVLIPGGQGLWIAEPVASHAFAAPGLIVYRFSSPLFYANAALFTDEIRSLAGEAVRSIVVDAGAIARLDYSAARRIEELLPDLAARGVQLIFTHVEAELMADLERHRLIPAIGRERIFDKLHDAVAALTGPASQSPSGKVSPH